jgi:predicted metal-dependent phosphoesterase TrpH
MKYMPLETCVKEICENGGVPVLAHPYHYHCTEEEVRKLIADFKKLTKGNPAGIEVYYSKYDKERRDILLKFAEEFMLYPSAASDRHDVKDPFVKGNDKLLEAMKNAKRG